MMLALRTATVLSKGIRGIRTTTGLEKRKKVLEKTIKKAVDFERRRSEKALAEERQEREKALAETEKAVAKLNERVSTLEMRQYANVLKKRIIEKVFPDKDVKLQDIKQIPGYIKRQESQDLHCQERWTNLENAFRCQGLDILMVGEDIRYFIDVGNIEAHPKIEYDTYMDRILLIDYKYWVIIVYIVGFIICVTFGAV